MSEDRPTRRLLYGHGDRVYAHVDLESWDEREAWASGFHRGAHQYAGEESFTIRAPLVEDDSGDEENAPARWADAKNYIAEHGDGTK